MDDPRFEFDEAQSIKATANVAKVIDGEVMIPLYILEEVNYSFALLIRDAILDGRPDFSLDYTAGAVSVMSVYKKISDGLLGHFASELVPDTIPEGFK
jgi:hypothetical protein